MKKIRHEAKIVRALGVRQYIRMLGWCVRLAVVGTLGMEVS